MKKYKLSKSSVFYHFQNVSEFRQEKKIRHKLIDIIVITVCAVVSGADCWSEVAMFARCKADWLKSFLELPNGIPVHDTFERVFRRINPEEFKKCFLSWVREVARITDGEIVAIDGKTVRGSRDGNRSAIHMVSAWATVNGVILGQTKVSDKSNEITAIPELLRLLVLKGCIVTVDAIGCQKDIAQQIVKKEADYVLALKENQPLFYDEVKEYFKDQKKNSFKDRKYDYHETIEKGHGRIEKRKYWITEDIDWYEERIKWEGLKSIGMVESERIIGDNKSIEIRYYISSIGANAKKFAGAVRGHWGIENSMHWVLDVVFNEDKNRVRKDYGPENLEVIRHVALNMMKRDVGTKLSMKAKRKQAEWSMDYMIKLVFGDLSGDDL